MIASTPDEWKVPNADSIYAVQRMHAIGVAAMAVSDFRLAAKMFDELIKLTPAPIHWISLGEALGKMGETARSCEAFESAIRMDPNYADSYYNMGVMLEQANEPEKAEEAYTKALALRETPEGRNNLANCQRALVKLEDAERNYRRATELGYPGAQMNLSLLLMLKGDYVRGIPLFELREQFGSDQAYGPAREMLALLKRAP